jgi:hypothetical protein
VVDLRACGPEGSASSGAEPPAAREKLAALRGAQMLVRALEATDTELPRGRERANVPNELVGLGAASRQSTTGSRHTRAVNEPATGCPGGTVTDANSPVMKVI